MPQILFDPPNEPQRGGAILSPTLRAEYMALCYKIVRPETCTREVADRMIEMMRDAARAQVEAIPAQYRSTLLEDMDQILASRDPAETNYLALVNITALQLAYLFTAHYQTLKNQTGFLAAQGITNYHFEFPNIDSAQNYFYERLENENWKDYNTFKDVIASLEVGDGEGISVFVNPVTVSPRFVPFIGFLTIREIVDAIFDDIYFLGLAFTSQYVDGGVKAPTAYFLHDFEHSAGLFEKRGSPELMQAFRHFRECLKANPPPPPVLYSVYFILFYMFHEGGANSVLGTRQKSFSIKNHLTGDLRTYIEGMIAQFTDNFVKLNDAGRSIPSSYRVLVEPTKLDRSKVKEYLELAVDRYMACWEACRQKGGSKGLKARKTRAAGDLKSRKTRKGLKSRKTRR
jgi:hypothetical protein